MTTVAPIDKEELRKRIVAELNIGHLTDDEQEKVINKVSEVLMKRATLEVMRRIPEDQLDELDKLTEAEDGAGIQKLGAKYVPNVEEVVTQAAKDGLAEHKRLVTELVAKQ